jgi:hypothetical protein
MKRVHTMSPKAKKVLNPALAVFIITWLSFLVHVIFVGTSGFPGGVVRVVDGKYLIEEHGKVFALTAMQYWFSYVHAVFFVAITVIIVILVVVFYWRRDLKDEYRDA